VRIRRLIQFATLLIASGVALSAGAGAQDEGATNGIATRAQTVTDAEQAKAEHLMPQEPPRGERKFDHIQKDILDRIFNTQGPSLKFGGIPTGGGFSLGPQYTRQDFLADHLTWNTYLAGSTRRWYGGGSSFDFHGLLNGHLELKTDGGYQNSTSVWYFGEGPDSGKNDKTDFDREFTTTHFAALSHFFDQKLTVGYIVGGLLVHVGPGDQSGTPTTEQVFTNTPGLVQQSNFITGTTTVQLDFTRVGFSSWKPRIRSSSIRAVTRPTFTSSKPKRNISCRSPTACVLWSFAFATRPLLPKTIRWFPSICSRPSAARTIFADSTAIVFMETGTLLPLRNIAGRSRKPSRWPFSAKGATFIKGRA